MSWLSLHCFVEATAQDALLTAIVPLVRAWRAEGDVAAWFFIRYWEGGPHLRVRLQGAGDPAPFAAALTTAIAPFVTATALTRDTYYAGHAFDGAAVDVATLPWFAPGSVVAVPYVPEVARYGGPDAICRSEQLFGQSSALAAALVRAVPDAAARTGPAFALMAVTARAVAGDAGIAGIADFAARYAAGWAEYAPANRILAARLAAEPPAPARTAALAALLAGSAAPLVAGWAAALAGFVADLAGLAAAGRLVAPFPGATTADTIGAIVGSQLHMLNNRLGLAPAVELILASHLARAAAALAAPLTLEMVA